MHPTNLGAQSPYGCVCYLGKFEISIRFPCTQPRVSVREPLASSCQPSSRETRCFRSDCFVSGIQKSHMRSRLEGHLRTLKGGVVLQVLNTGLGTHNSFAQVGPLTQSFLPAFFLRKRGQLYAYFICAKGQSLLAKHSECSAGLWSQSLLCNGVFYKTVSLTIDRYLSTEGHMTSRMTEFSFQH